MKNKFIETIQTGIYDDKKAIIYHSVFAKEVLRLYEEESDSFEERILGIRSIPESWKNTKEEIHQTKELNNFSGLQDKRISSIMIHGIRGIKKERDNIYYGFECTDDNNKICSMVLIGANGIGKTSFYSAMEVAGMGISNCAKLRGYELDKELSSFMLNINNAGENGMILIKTGDGKVSSFGFKDKMLDTKNGLDIRESCFCSDFDIQFLETCSYSTSQRSFTQFIHSQLNLGGFDRVLRVLKQYQEKLIARGSSIIEDSKTIDNLKGKEFFLKIEHFFLCEIHHHTTRLTNRITDFFIGASSDKISGIEKIIEEGKGEALSIPDLKLLYWHYSSEFHLLCNVIYAFEEKQAWNRSKQILTLADENFYYQCKEDIDNIYIPSFYPKCLVILKKLFFNKLTKSNFSKKKDLFHNLCESRKKIANIIRICLEPASNASLKNRKAEIAKALGSNQKEIDRFKMSIIGQIPIDMAKIDQLIESCRKLISYLELKLCEYDIQIFNLLKAIIPALCSQSFSKKQGEEIIINYGVIDNLNNDNNDKLNVKFDKPKPFELFIKIIKKDEKTGKETYEKADPRLYLNTFRHKLFCFALKLGLAICAMKIDKCKYPIVIDDVFDASDFMNRNEISNVIKSLLEQYTILAPDFDNLQIILLTQDEIIAERVFVGMTHAKNKARLVRLMNPNEYKDSVAKELNVDLTEYKMRFNPIGYLIDLFTYNLSYNSGHIIFHNVTDIVKSNFL